MSYVEGLVIIVGMIIATFCIKEIIKTVFVEFGLYKQKLNKPYEKAVNGFFQSAMVLVEKMGQVLDKEIEVKTVKVNWDEESLKE